MLIAMNRFRVRRGAEGEFERVWRERDSRLAGVAGFVEFRLLRGPQRDDHTLYASHSVWRDREAFEAWTRSDAFRHAHRGAGGTTDLYLAPPELELFDTVTVTENV